MLENSSNIRYTLGGKGKDKIFHYEIDNKKQKQKVLKECEKLGITEWE